MNEEEKNKRFSIVQRAKSFTHAGRGIRILFLTTHNSWVHLLVLLLAVLLGLHFNIAINEWALLILAAGLVLTTEAINTAIEIDINLTSPRFHPYARDTKDVAAGAVLIAAITAALIGICIFAPYILVAIGN